VPDRSIRSAWTAILVGLLVCLPSAVRAQGRTRERSQLHPLVSQLDPAWNRLAASNAKFLTEDQQRLLDDLAFAVAVGGGCPGFQVDQDKFKQAFEGFRTDDYMHQSPDQKRQREYRLMMNFGATVALYTAEGLLHPKEACKFAEGKRAEGPGRFWVQPTSAAPAK